jgi:nucleotide sugar dehydrogenase
MGLPLSQVLAQHYTVIGVDINEALVRLLTDGVNPINDEVGLTELLEKNLKAKRYVATTSFEYAAKNSDTHIILVPTLVKEGKPDLSVVKQVAEHIAKGLKKGDIVITECTMPPGSTEQLVPILERSGLRLGEFGLAHCPERTMAGTAIRDITGEYPKIVGASDEKTLRTLSQLYSTVNKKGVTAMSSIKVAECVKVFEGCYRDVNIALANELSYVCEKHGVSSQEVFDAANSQPYCKIHRPGYVGGHCIPFYPIFVMDENTHLLRTARQINENIIDRVLMKVVGGMKEVEQPIKSASILILGLTYRGGVYGFEHTGARPFINKLKQLGPKVYAYDPLCSEQDYREFGVEQKRDFKNVDCVVILGDHKKFSQIDFEREGKVMRNRVIVDMRRVVDTTRLHGFTYMTL